MPPRRGWGRERSLSVSTNEKETVPTSMERSEQVDRFAASSSRMRNNKTFARSSSLVTESVASHQICTGHAARSTRVSLCESQSDIGMEVELEDKKDSVSVISRAKSGILSTNTGASGTLQSTDAEMTQPLLAGLLTAIVSRVVQGVPGVAGDMVQPVSRRAVDLLLACGGDADTAAALVVQEVKTTLSSEALRTVGATVGSAFGGAVGGLFGVAVGITAGQCANVWAVARTVALIAAIYGHDVEDRDVQYDVVLCLCHSVFTSQRENVASPLSEPQGWVGWAKSWGRYTAQALVSRAFGWSLLAGVPLTVAVQAIIGFSESNTAAVEVAQRAVTHFRPVGDEEGVRWWGVRGLSRLTRCNPLFLKLVILAMLAFVPKVIPVTARLQAEIRARLAAPALALLLPQNEHAGQDGRAAYLAAVLAWCLAVLLVVAGTAASLACVKYGYKPLLRHRPSALPLLVLGAMPAADFVGMYSASAAACMGCAAASRAFQVYYVHKAVVAAVAVFTRRMATRSNATEQLRTMLQGSLLTWSVWLTAGYLTEQLSDASTNAHRGEAASRSEWRVPSDAGPVLDAISTVALSMLMDRLSSPTLLVHALGPGVLVRRAAKMLTRVGSAAVQPAMTLQWMHQCCPAPHACGMVMALKRAWLLGGVLAVLVYGPKWLVVVPVTWPTALLLVSNTMLGVMLLVWQEHGAALMSERRLLLLLPPGSDLHAQVERALDSMKSARSAAERATRWYGASGRGVTWVGTWLARSVQWTQSWRGAVHSNSVDNTVNSSTSSHSSTAIISSTAVITSPRGRGKRREGEPRRPVEAHLAESHLAQVEEDGEGESPNGPKLPAARSSTAAASEQLGESHGDSSVQQAIIQGQPHDDFALPCSSEPSAARKGVWGWVFRRSSPSRDSMHSLGQEEEQEDGAARAASAAADLDVQPAPPTAVVLDGTVQPTHEPRRGWSFWTWSRAGDAGGSGARVAEAVSERAELASVQVPQVEDASAPVAGADVEQDAPSVAAPEKPLADEERETAKSDRKSRGWLWGHYAAKMSSGQHSPTSQDAAGEEVAETGSKTRRDDNSDHLDIKGDPDADKDKIANSEPSNSRSGSGGGKGWGPWGWSWTASPSLPQAALGEAGAGGVYVGLAQLVHTPKGMSAARFNIYARDAAPTGINGASPSWVAELAATSPDVSPRRAESHSPPGLDAAAVAVAAAGGSMALDSATEARQEASSCPRGEGSSHVALARGGATEHIQPSAMVTQSLKGGLDMHATTTPPTTPSSNEARQLSDRGGVDPNALDALLTSSRTDLASLTSAVDDSQVVSSRNALNGTERRPHTKDRDVGDGIRVVETLQFDEEFSPSTERLETAAARGGLRRESVDGVYEDIGGDPFGDDGGMGMSSSESRGERWWSRGIGVLGLRWTSSVRNNSEEDLSAHAAAAGEPTRRVSLDGSSHGCDVDSLGSCMSPHSYPPSSTGKFGDSYGTGTPQDSGRGEKRQFGLAGRRMLTPHSSSKQLHDGSEDGDLPRNLASGQEWASETHISSGTLPMGALSQLLNETLADATDQSKGSACSGRAQLSTTCREDATHQAFMHTMAALSGSPPSCTEGT